MTYFEFCDDIAADGWGCVLPVGHDGLCESDEDDAGHEAVVPHPAMEAVARALPLLNRYTAEVLRRAGEVEVPDGWTLIVAADSDLVLSHPMSGEWVGLRLLNAGAAEARQSWRCARGSLYEDDLAFDDNLQRAISYFVAQHARRQIRVGR